MKWWTPTRRSAVLTVAAAGLVVTSYLFDRRIPLLSLVDLGFHELGHMLAIPLGRTVHFLAGSFAQIAVPVGLAAYFAWLRSDRAAAGLMGAWAATSIRDVAVYVADAPYQRLPLIGGTHDWAWLLGSRWHVIDRADDLAGFFTALGLLVGIAAIGLAASPFLGPKQDTSLTPENIVVHPLFPGDWERT
ncbi:MAG: hypothetical protein OEO77_07325 [Acidimicrobiia bacterium]|nr:hypothetical protein [Acidimicrobiia bacterium]